MAQSFVRCDRHGNVVGNLLGVMSAVRDQSADSTSNADYATADKLTVTLTGELDEGDRILWQDPKGKWWEWACKVPDAKRGDSIAVSTDICVSSWEFDLAGKWVEEIKVATSGNGTTNVKTPAEVLALVLNGSAWSVGTVDGSEPVEFYGSDTSDYTSYYKTDALTCVHRLCKYFGLEAYPTVEVSGNSVTSRKVNLVKRRGSADPVWRFSYSRDLQGVRRTFSGTPVYTKLHVFGKGDPIMNELNVFTGAYDKKITFADINDGKDYLEDDSLLANFGTLGPNGTTVHTEGRVDFDQCEDAALLLKWGREYFKKQKTPEVSYELDVTATNKAGMGYGGCDIGDAVQVVDTSFPEDLRLSARVIELEEDLLGGAQTLKVTLGSVIRSITGNAASTANSVADIQANMPAWNQSGGLFSDYLEKLRKQMNEEFLRNGTYHTTSFTLGDIWSSVEVDTDTGQPKNPSASGDKWAINISSAGFRIASSLNSDGTWKWTTIGNGKGIVADAITSGILKAGRIEDSTGQNYWDLDSGTLVLNHGTITTDRIKTSDGKSYGIIGKDVNGKSGMSLVDETGEFFKAAAARLSTDNEETTGAILSSLSKTFLYTSISGRFTSIFAPTQDVDSGTTLTYPMVYVSPELLIAGINDTHFIQITDENFLLRIGNSGMRLSKSDGASQWIPQRWS